MGNKNKITDLARTLSTNIFLPCVTLVTSSALNNATTFRFVRCCFFCNFIYFFCFHLSKHQKTVSSKLEKVFFMFTYNKLACVTDSLHRRNKRHKSLSIIIVLSFAFEWTSLFLLSFLFSYFLLSSQFSRAQTARTLPAQPKWTVIGS